MNPKVSVIVPVYNGQDTISTMVDSLLNQTLRDIEILLIDDGSTDKTPAILDSYGQKDERVRVFHKPNGGVAMQIILYMQMLMIGWRQICWRKCITLLLRKMQIS